MENICNTENGMEFFSSLLWISLWTFLHKKSSHKKWKIFNYRFSFYIFLRYKKKKKNKRKMMTWKDKNLWSKSWSKKNKKVNSSIINAFSFFMWKCFNAHWIFANIVNDSIVRSPFFIFYFNSQQKLPITV